MGEGGPSAWTACFPLPWEKRRCLPRPCPGARKPGSFPTGWTPLRDEQASPDPSTLGPGPSEPGEEQSVTCGSRTPPAPTGFCAWSCELCRGAWGRDLAAALLTLSKGGHLWDGAPALRSCETPVGRKKQLE